jgi:WD40 repeat protein
MVAALGGSSIILYSTRDWNPVGRIAVSAPGEFESAQAIAFSSDGETLAVGVYSASLISGKVKLFNLKSIDSAPSVLAAYSGVLDIGVNTLSFSLDGRFLAIGAAGSSGRPVINGGSTDIESAEAAHMHAPIKVFRLADKAVIAAYPGHFAPVDQVSWSADGRFVAAATAGDDIVRVFAPEVPERAIAVSSRYSSVMSVSFSPDGKLIAAATDNAVTVFALPLRAVA